MIENLIHDVEFMAVFYAIVDGAKCNDLDQDIKHSILLSMLKLFLKVRAFSLSCDIVAKHRLQLKNKKTSNTHGLRNSSQEATSSGKHDVDFVKNHWRKN